MQRSRHTTPFAPALLAAGLLAAVASAMPALDGPQSSGGQQPVDDPPEIEVDGCDEWEENAFQLLNVGSISRNILWPPGTDIDAEIAAARAEILGEVFALCVQRAAALGIEPPDCPTEECFEEGGLGCQAGFNITEGEDVSETGSTFWTFRPWPVPVRYYRITLTFEQIVTVDIGCSPCQVDPANIG